MVQKFIFLSFILLPFLVQAQERKTATFGSPTPTELAMATYKNDPEAAGVVLYEKGSNYVKVIDDRIWLIKEVHKKIKVLDAKRFEEATVKILLYKGGNINETIKSLKAITHNGLLQNFVAESAIYTKEETPDFTSKTFTFPNVKDGSILEYNYLLLSPYFSNFGGWQFQETLPKIYSEYSTEIPGNYVYNKILIGKLPLDINEVNLKRNCFSIPGFAKDADCEAGLYAMFNVPAVQEEPYMLATENYAAKIDFELKEYTDFKGIKTEYTKEWKDADKVFRTDKNMGGQLKYDSYFKGVLPQEILTIADEMEKAKAVYNFIRGHYTWNGKNRIFSDVRVKESFSEKSGNSSEINIALINALEAASLKTNLILMSTRDNGLPTLSYPVINDFNYALALLTINNEKYVLDATDKFIPFAMVPFRALNVQGRVMDFKEGSYWLPIVPSPKNQHYVNAQLSASETGSLEGNVNEVFTGYLAVNNRTLLDKKGIVEFTKQIETNTKGFEINSLKLENETLAEEPFKENYRVDLEPENVGETIYIYPFFMDTYISENPFKGTERIHPIDFGFPVTNTYLISIDLKNEYEVVSLPANKAIKLPNDDGEFSVVYEQKNTLITIRLNTKLNTYTYPKEAYKALQELFASLIETQTKIPIVVKKK